MEFHPRIDNNALRLKEDKIILGSFPTWSLSGIDPEKNETLEEKSNERIKNGEIPFFYGSSNNKFWNWFKKYVDPDVNVEDIISIKNSLNNNCIGITDVILSCHRKGKSALDKHLSKRIYNHQFFKIPKEGRNIKILCTSKGVMNEMLLNKKFFQTHTYLSLNEEKSKMFENQLMKAIGGDSTLIRQPIYRHIESNDGGSISCVALPSPGSAYRKLKDFGFSSENSDEYLDRYLNLAFKWFGSKTIE